MHYLLQNIVVQCDKNTMNGSVVYNASARCGGPCIMECCHCGPKFCQQIFNLLFKFRMYCLTLTADIEKAFLMIQMDEEDQEVLRFLLVGGTMKEYLNLWSFNLPELSSKTKPALVEKLMRRTMSLLEWAMKTTRNKHSGVYCQAF